MPTKKFHKHPAKTMSSHSQGEWLVLLQSKRRLDREKGLQQLQQQVNEGKLGEDERRESEREVLELVTSLTSSWETKHGGLMAASLLLPGASPQFVEKMKREVPLLLEYDESRVRLAAGVSVSTFDPSEYYAYLTKF